MSVKDLLRQRQGLGDRTNEGRQWGELLVERLQQGTKLAKLLFNRRLRWVVRSFGSTEGQDRKRAEGDRKSGGNGRELDKPPHLCGWKHQRSDHRRPGHNQL